MMKFKIAVLSLAMFATAAQASDSFFSRDVQPGPYMVYGVKGDRESKSNPACYAEVTWRDGSKMQLIRDLQDGELYIWMKNTSWNITDQPGKYKLRLNFEKNGNLLRGMDFTYDLVNKNTIVIRNIKKELFLPMFTAGTDMRVIMPGSIQNAIVSLLGSSRTIDAIGDCVDRAIGENLWPSGQPDTNDTNRSFDRI